MSGNTSRSRTRRDGTARRGRAPATPPTPASARGLPQAARSRAPAPADEPVGCRAHEVLARVGDKWSVYVIHVLGEAGTLRFGELRRRVEGISQRMLTVTLRSLERDGLVSRRMYPEVPPRVEYALTPLAITLRGIVGELVEWSQAHLAEIDAARSRYDGQAPGWATAER